ncbi:hypothetical protein Mapa_011383 [Marchantia paleacea]|nr:hypothetical protein Mapa_011383 [Marchantia paleacea]
MFTEAVDIQTPSHPHLLEFVREIERSSIPIHIKCLRTYTKRYLNLFDKTATSSNSMAPYSSSRALTVAMVAVVMLVLIVASSVSPTGAEILVENRSQKNASVHDLTSEFFIDPLLVGHTVEFANISEGDQHVFKITNLDTMELISRQFLTSNAKVAIVDDDFGGLSMIFASGSCAKET